MKRAGASTSGQRRRTEEPLPRVTVVVPGEAVGLIQDPAPLAIMPLRGFGGDGALCRHNRRGSLHVAQQNPHKNQVGARQERREKAREAGELPSACDSRRNQTGRRTHPAQTQGNVNRPRKLTPNRRLILTPLASMIWRYWIARGRVKEPRASAPSSSAVASERLASSGAVLEAPAFVPGLDDVAVVGQTIKQRARHLGVYENARPFAKSEIGREDD
jgi:hypothetical protein